MFDMTIRQVMTKYLTENGMFQDQADTVIKRYTETPIGDSMKGRWDEDSDAYPSQLMPVVIIGLRHEALTFIIEKCPQAWFRPMFEDTTQAETTP
jgi:hypothetical protein